MCFFKSCTIETTSRTCNAKLSCTSLLMPVFQKGSVFFVSCAGITSTIFVHLLWKKTVTHQKTTTGGRQKPWKLKWLKNKSEKKKIYKDEEIMFENLLCFFFILFNIITLYTFKMCTTIIKT